MSRALIIVLAAMSATLVILVPIGLRTNLDLTLSCRNELHDSHGDASTKHYLIADMALQGNRGSMCLRYFDEEGEAHSRITLTGTVSRGALFEEVYELAIDTVDTQILQPDAPSVNHMQYMSGFTKSNLSNLGSHNLTIRVLKRDEREGYALLFVQPSNAVAACSIVQ